MAKYLDVLGVGILWNKMLQKITEVVQAELTDLISEFNTIKQEALTIKQEALAAKNDAQYYYNLTVEAINSLDPDVANTLTYAQKVAKHGQAIEKIAEQLNSTYNEEGVTTADAYTPGYLLRQVTEDKMNELIENDEVLENGIYFVKE